MNDAVVLAARAANLPLVLTGDSFAGNVVGGIVIIIACAALAALVWRIVWKWMDR